MMFIIATIASLLWLAVVQMEVTWLIGAAVVMSFFTIDEIVNGNRRRKIDIPSD